MKNITPKDIIEVIAIKEFQGDRSGRIEKIVGLDSVDLDETSLYWCSDKNRNGLLKVNKGYAIVSESTFNFIRSEAKQLLETEVSWFVVHNPRLTFMEILKEFYMDKPIWGEIHNTSDIHESTKFNRSLVNIGANVVIEKDCILGENVAIGHNTVIKSGTIIKNGVVIGSNNTIGGVGFGYEMNEKGEYEVIPHIGNVVIHQNVEIGNNVCIDRAVLGSTVIEENVKIDNLVHIAHGVHVGRNSLIIANSMIAGSTRIGENVWISPSVSVIQKSTIGDDSLVGMGSVVLKNVDPSTIVAGVPAKKIRDK
ncbi:MAG: UDP-3-O-(3-hydroxymyristoyl)glucosamine N-acyltransferase [Crocinitomicaceae bacterium]|nr:UDP-3-O-(3-hydroxymyristoyl)glucosamine N-acyltransferase [Crocinitomicaceae bacterium]